MKLRSLTLSNVRKFAGQTASIKGIGDGVTVVSEANEFGKSTFFDALHALFFLKYGGATKDVKSLQPRAGGPVRVAAEIELPEGRFILEKSFLAQKRASVRDALGTLIAQDDEAERWIAALMERGLEGPAGLLWVRQGTTTLEPLGTSGAEKSEKERLLGARRDLLSSVAGEIDMVTGGRRMDRVIEAARAALARLATATGQPKASGPWKDAVQEAETLGQRKVELEEACSRLTAALAKRRQVVSQLTALDQAEAHQARRAALEAAETAQRAAAAHADRLKEAQGLVRLKTLEHDNARASLDGLLKHAEDHARAAKALTEATTRLESCQSDAEAAEKRARATETAWQGATDTLAKLRHARDAAQQGALRRNAQEKYAALAKRHAEALDSRDALEKARAAFAAQRVTAPVLERIEEAHAAWKQAQADVASGGVRMHLRYTGAQRLLLDGAPLDADTHTVLARQVFDLPGIGQMTLDPGAASADMGQVTQAETGLQALLDQAGVPDLAAARTAARRRQDAQSEVKLTETVLATLAPDGMPALQAALAEAAAQSEALSRAPEVPSVDPETLVRDLEAAQIAEHDHREAHEAGRTGYAAAQTALARAQAQQGAAQTAFETAAEAFGDPGTYQERKAGAARAQAVAEAALQEAAHVAAELATAAPDHATVAANLARARSAVENAQRDIARLTAERADLGATIRARAEDGVEEALAETTGRHQLAEERAARFAHEVESLTLLVETLAATRGAAQDAYFGPVQQELAPLLSILHADAALSFDPASLLPSGLARDGAEEPLDVLSGGTQEQIAILTRLAFARLFAKQGRPMPIVLDDALVYSDDDRIIKMFTALHRVALDQQVIVFSCRQMAFNELGGTRPTVEIAPIP